MGVILHFLLFIVLIPGSWQRGCTQEFDDSGCTSIVYCEHALANVGWIENAINYNCLTEETFRYNGHRFGETIYTLKHMRDVYAELADTYCRQIITVLDLSDDEYTSVRLPNMPHLRVLNISGNILTAASLYSSSNLDLLTEIDLSHNSIDVIEVDNNFIVFRQLKKINLSYNNLAVIQDGIFDSFTELQYLDLSFNFIDTLNILTFEGLKNVEYLNLKHNRLAEIGGSLPRFSKLKELDLSDNKIERINDVDLEKLTSLEILYLNSNLIKNVEKNVFHKNVAIKVLNLSDNLLEKVAKETFTNLALLKNIDLSKNNVKNLPAYLFKEKQISSFSIAENKLEGSLVKGMFEGIELITELDLSNQQFETIEDQAFNGLQYLKILLLNSNKINSISKKSFNTLRSLENLDLSNNQLANIEFDKDDLVSLKSLILLNNRLTQIKQEYFDSLNNLQFLDLSNNQISVLETNSFKSLKDLINFKISNNPISGAIEERTFNGLINLPSLDVSGTSLTAIKNCSFYGMTQLKELYVSHSQIIELQFNSFLHTGIIELIDLSFNNLTEFNINTTELGNLKKLMLNNNLIKSLSSFCFKSLIHLSDITLSHNQLKSVALTTLEDQKDIQYLDLSYNPHLILNIPIFEGLQHLVKLSLSGILSNITFSPMKVPRLEMSYSNIQNITLLELKKIKDLDELVLSHNNISKLGSTAFSGINSLRVLDLSHNKITFIQPGAFKDNTLLNFLNVSHNMLTTVSYGIFRGLIYLDTVDISFNEISDLQSERFYEVRSLTTLIADHNKIKNIEADKFLGTNLKSLSIGDNPMACHILVNLKKSSSFEITALRLDERSDAENIDGVTCNMDRSVAKSKFENEPQENLQNKKLLLDIKDILYNISLSKIPEPSVITVANNDSSSLNIISKKIDEGYSNISLLLQKISSASINTYELLDRMLKLSPNASVERNENQNDKLLLDIKNILHNTSKSPETFLTVSNNDSILSNIINQKINYAVSSKSGSDSKWLIFIGVCVFLMLAIMVSLILYNFYNNTRTRPSSNTISTRPLFDSIENSSL